jgi:hypothetical protein
MCAGGSPAADARFRVLRTQFHLAVVKVALTKELIAKHRELIRSQEKAGLDTAQGERLLQMLHNLQMLFVADVEAFEAEAQKLEGEFAGNSEAVFD